MQQKTQPKYEIGQTVMCPTASYYPLKVLKVTWSATENGYRYNLAFKGIKRWETSPALNAPEKDLRRATILRRLVAGFRAKLNSRANDYWIVGKGEPGTKTYTSGAFTRAEAKAELARLKTNYRNQKTWQIHHGYPHKSDGM